MSDHCDSDDPRTDLMDLYAFPAPSRPDRTVLIRDVNPEPSPHGLTKPEVVELLPQYLPDVLEYDPSKPAGHPNGRRLTDDTADLLASLRTRGRITSDLAGTHTDLHEVSPYLGAPRSGESVPTV